MHHPVPLSWYTRLGGIWALLGAALCGAAWADPGVTADTVTLGQSTTLSGPLGDLGQEVLRGETVYFDALNARGGVHGRSVKLVVKDDAYDSKKTVEITESFIAGDAVFALFSPFGTPNNEALLPLALKADIPVLMPYTGAPSVRSPKITSVFNLRASYADEVERQVEHLATLGTTRIAIAYQNNSFGKEVLAAATQAMERRKLRFLLAVPVESSASDAPAATEKLLTGDPQALLLALAGKPAIEVIKHVNKQRRGLPLYALSVLATPANLRSLGADGTGLAITQVVPFPANATIPLVREYQQAMMAAGSREFSHQSLEGYLNAKLVTEALRRAGRNLTREALVSALASMRNYNLGGMDVSFGQGAASGTRFVELTMVNQQGKLIK